MEDNSCCKLATLCSGLKHKRITVQPTQRTGALAPALRAGGRWICEYGRRPQERANEWANPKRTVRTIAGLPGDIQPTAGFQIWQTRCVIEAMVQLGCCHVINRIRMRHGKHTDVALSIILSRGVYLGLLAMQRDT